MPPPASTAWPRSLSASRRQAGLPLLRTAPTELPRWLSHTTVAWIAGVLALITLGLGAGFMALTVEQRNRSELQSSEVMARVLEDQADRAFNSIDATLTALGGNLRVPMQPDELRRYSATLLAAQQGLPFVRSVSLIDAQGRVLASSVPANVGVSLDLERIPLPKLGMRDRLGARVAGRDLFALARGAPPATGASLQGFVPLTREVTAPLDAARYLVVAINLDFFANSFETTLGDSGQHAALLGMDGELWAATTGVDQNPGTSARNHRFFVDFLPAKEAGSYIGIGLDNDKVVTAMRALRQRPIVVVVERDYSAVQSSLKVVAIWVGATVLVVFAVIALLAGAAQRSLRSHGAVYAELLHSRTQLGLSERELRSLVDGVQEVIFRTDERGFVRFVNQRWQQISGHSNDALVGHRLVDVCVDADRNAVANLFTSGNSAERNKQALRVLTAEGSIRTFEVAVNPVIGDDGRVQAYAGFAVDITEKLLARLNLQAQLDFSSRLIEISPTPLFVKDVDGRFITVNRAWLDLVGFELDDVIGKTSEDLFGPQAPMHSAQDLRVLYSEERLRYANTLMRQDGERRETLVTKVRFTQADGSPAGVLGSIIDVTEFREAERSTRIARDAAEQANQAKSMFIANISHELRTPLQSIIGFSELGHDRTEVGSMFHDMFADIQAGGQRMLRLVNRMLDLSKMENTVGTLSLLQQDVVALTLEVVRELIPIADQNGVLIEWNKPEKELAAAVDAFRFQQVVRNVLANALRFAPRGTAVEIVFSDLAAEGVEISFRDHGPGIPEAELDTIFEAFVQSSRTQDGAGGTGLGLTISRKIMAAHGGEITARNASETGAIMTLRLPNPKHPETPDPA